MSLRPGDHLGPYEVVGLIGAGGMGAVYRAKDPRLDREVAVKVLPDAVASDPERLARFDREARALARLSHPNILAVYDVGRDGNAAYVVTELLRGETLRQRLSREHLSWRKAVEIAASVADGLSSAHAHGIVHRDLKPENVFLTADGQPRILDFGIARLDRAGAPEAETQPGASPSTGAGVLLGTVGYMAPEQVCGEPGDARSDIFALGCVLFEMLSGRRPFARDTVGDTLRAVQAEPLPEIADLNLGVPPEVSRIVAHCVEKDQDSRFQSARDLAFDLRASLTSAVPAAVATPRGPAPGWRARWPGFAAIAATVVVVAGLAWLWSRETSRPSGGGASVAPGEQARIVVLPFENLGAQDDAYFAAGMTEEVTSRLAGVKGLAVTSRTTAMQYDRKGKTLKTLGVDLGVDYVLEGTVRWDRSQGGSGRVRITPQLIRVADDAHVWASTYDRELADVFALQSDVAGEVVRALGQSLTPREADAVKRVPTRDLEAYDLYLKAARLTAGSFDAAEIAESIRLLEQAIARDPEFAEAHALLARRHLITFWLHLDRSQSRLERARVLAERAVSLAPDIPETHLALAYYHYHGQLDYQGALAGVQAAQQLRPRDAETIALEGFVRRRAGQVENAARLIELAASSDPGNANFQHNLAETYWLLRRYPAADRTFARALAINPNWGREYSYRAAVRLCQTGDLEEARALLARASAVTMLVDAMEVSDRQVQFDLLARRYDEALKHLETIGVEAFSEQYFYVPLSRLAGDALRLKGDRQGARRAYSSALAPLERERAQRPDDSRILSALGLVHAGLGHRDEAIRAATKGVQLMPLSKEAYRGAFRLEDLAKVHALVGDPEQAISHLDELLTRPGWLCAPVVHLDPAWDPLRANPRFRALLEKHGVQP